MPHLLTFTHSMSSTNYAVIHVLWKKWGNSVATITNVIFKGRRKDIDHIALHYTTQVMSRGGYRGACVHSNSQCGRENVCVCVELINQTAFQVRIR